MLAIMLLPICLLIMMKSSSSLNTVNDQLVLPFSLIKSSKSNRHYFSVRIELGSSYQAFDVELDTSCGNTWVPSVKCGKCTEGGLYDPSLSSSSQQMDTEVVLYDEDCVVTGYKVFDQIKIDKIKAKRYGFVHVTQFGQNFNDNFEGKLGLGYRSVLGSGYNLLNALKRSNEIAYSMFTIAHLNETNGQLTLGGSINGTSNSFLSRMEGPKPVCNVTLLHYESVDYIYREGWICFLTHFIISEKYPDFYEHKDAGNPVLFDSAYEFISIPIRYYYVIKERLFDGFLPDSCGEQIAEDVYLTEKYFICSNSSMDIKKVNFTFLIQGYAYSIRALDLFRPVNESHYESLIRFNVKNDMNFWMLGYPFMKNFIISYDYQLSHVAFQEGNGTIVNLTEDWELWDRRKMGIESNDATGEAGLSTKGIVIITIVIALVLIAVIACLVVRSLRRKRVEDTRPFVYPSN